MDKRSKQQLIQESQYSFPYHFIPYNDDEIWMVSRHLSWGYEYLAVLETITALVMNNQPKRIVDFGCGDGRLINELCKQQIDEVVGVDISEHALLFSRAMIGCHGKVRFCRTLKELPGERFDVAIAMEVLEHIPPSNLQGILADIRVILKEKGIFVISVPTWNISLNRKHYRHFTTAEVEREIAGLFAIDQVYFIHKIGVFANALRRTVFNKFFVPNWKPWLRLTTFLYKRYIMRAEEANGAHLIAVLRKS